MAKPHVVLIPSWFPSHHHALNGVFLAEQARLLSHHAKVGVIYPDLRSGRQLRPSTLVEQRLQTRETVEDGVTVVRHLGWNVPLPRIQAQLFVGPALRLLRGYVRRHGRPDLLHGHSMFWGGRAASVAAHLIGAPYVITEHWSGYRDGELTAWEEVVARRTFAGAESIVSVSHDLRRALIPYVGGRDLHVIPNPIDTAFFLPPDRLPRRIPLTVVTIGGLNEVKRFDLLITAFAMAFGPRSDSRPTEARLIVGGDGPLRGALADLAERLGVAAQVQFVGAVKHEGVRQILHQGHVFVSSSRTETFGMAIAEAQATGLPVIATRSGGAEEIVLEGTGVLVPVDDAQALAGALRSFRDGDMPSASPSVVRAGIVERYGAESVTERLVSLYHHVLAERR